MEVDEGHGIAASPPRAAEGGDKPEGCTALTLAAENGRAGAVRALAEARADVNARSGTTPDPANDATCGA